MILTNFNSESIRLIAFDFSLNCDPAIKDFSNLAMNNIAENENDAPTIELSLFDKNFV